MIRLGVNVDHVATLREARRTIEPDPVIAAGVCELAGAHGITVHLREDRRHIKERDVRILRQVVRTRLNLEMANIPEIVEIALDVKPDQITLVPERRKEITTEGGLDVVAHEQDFAELVERARDRMSVSLFVDPVPEQVEAAARTGAGHIELHTGAFANARDRRRSKEELRKLINAADLGHAAGLRIHAGHGIDYWNVEPLADVPWLEEMNIGHSILARAVLVGLDHAVRDMLCLMNRGKRAGAA